MGDVSVVGEIFACRPFFTILWAFYTCGPKGVAGV